MKDPIPLERFRGGLTTAKLVRSFSQDVIDAMLERTRDDARAAVPGIDGDEMGDPDEMVMMLDQFQAHWLIETSRMLWDILCVLLSGEEKAE